MKQKINKEIPRGERLITPIIEDLNKRAVAMRHNIPKEAKNEKGLSN